MREACSSFFFVNLMVMPQKQRHSNDAQRQRNGVCNIRRTFAGKFFHLITINENENVNEEILDVVHGCRYTDHGLGTGRDNAAPPACGGTAPGG